MRTHRVACAFALRCCKGAFSCLLSPREGWAGTFYTETYSAFNIYLLSAWPTINADNSYVAAVRVLGNQQATSVTLNTSGYNGSYYVLMGFSNNNSRSFTGYIYSLKCNF